MTNGFLECKPETGIGRGEAPVPETSKTVDPPDDGWPPRPLPGCAAAGACPKTGDEPDGLEEVARPAPGCRPFCLVSSRARPLTVVPHAAVATSARQLPARRVRPLMTGSV